MITLTFDEYDKMEEAVEKMAVPPNYTPPKMEEIKNLMVVGKEELQIVLFALSHSTDKLYKKELNDILYDSLFLISEENQLEELLNSKKSNPFIPKIENIKRISNTVGSMTFIPTYYFPTKEEIVSSIKCETEEEFAFLVWLTLCSIDLTEEEKECRDYILQLIQEKTKECM